MSPESGVRSPQSGCFLRLWTVDRGLWTFQPLFPPDFGKTLPLAIVVAEHMDGIALAQPAMQLGKEFAPLLLGDQRLQRALRQRTKRLEALERKMPARRGCGAPGIGARERLHDLVFGRAAGAVISIAMNAGISTQRDQGRFPVSYL